MARNKEGPFQTTVRENIEAMLPGAIVIKGDSSYRQGVPDLIVFYEDRWAALEVKKSAKETPRPNQPYYVELLNEMSFSAFIYPENKEEVLRELQQTLRAKRTTRVSRS